MRLEQWRDRARLRLRGFLRRSSVERDIDDELQFHLEQQTAHYVERGLTPEDAARAARRRFGNPVAERERLRDIDIPFHIDLWWRDVCFACRQLLRSPAYALVTVAALAMGVGANVTIFSFANGWLVRPLDARDPDRLVRISGPGGNTMAAGGIDDEANILPADYPAYKDRNQTFAELAASHPGGPTRVRWQGPPEMIPVMRVAGNYFELLGVPAALGRTIAPADARFAHEVVVLSDAGWRKYFHEDANVVGTSVVLDGIPHVIVGVLPAWFTGTYAPMVPQIYRPIPERGGTLSFNFRLQLIGRLKPGVSREQAYADLNRIAAQLTARDGQRRAIEIYPARNVIPFMLTPLVLLTALFGVIVAVVLLIACDNVAILTALRSAARTREIAIRLSLGASRSRIVIQLAIESALLCAAAGLAGTATAFAIARLATQFYVPVPMPFALTFKPDWRVVLFAVLASVFALVLCGLVPALKTLKTDLIGAVRRTPAPRAVQEGLVITQVALSTMLLVTAAALAHSLIGRTTAPVGFASRGVVMSTLALNGEDYGADRRRTLIDDVLTRVERATGVAAAAAVANVPAANNAPLKPLGLRSGAEQHVVQINLVSRGMFATLGIPLVAGRDFQPSDDRSPAWVGIVNETLARQFWPGTNAVGQTLTDDRGGVVQVIGVVRDSEQVPARDEAAAPWLYRPIALDPPGSPTFLLKPSDAPQPVLGLVRSTVTALDPDMVAYNVMLLDDRLLLGLVVNRAAAIASGAMGALALLLGGIGLYGTMSFLAHQRRREIAVRTALGASPAQMRSLLTKQPARWTASGLVVGLGLAVLTSFGLSRVLRGVSPWDPAAVLLAAAAISATTFIAAYLPARRASALDPVAILRDGIEG